MRIEVKQVGFITENCYFVINEETKEVVIIDPGDAAAKLTDYMEGEKLHPTGILLTHGHFDHTGAVMELKHHYGIKAYIHEEEEQVLADKTMHLGKKDVTADVFLKDGEEVLLAGFFFKVLHTPGHTPGGCCYYMEKEKVLFAGDTLFHESVGRTDFKGGSGSELTKAVTEKLFVLPEDVKVYPGHMEETTIGHEKTYNPFF